MEKLVAVNWETTTRSRSKQRARVSSRVGPKRKRSQRHYLQKRRAKINVSLAQQALKKHKPETTKICTTMVEEMYRHRFSVVPSCQHGWEVTQAE